MTKIRSLFLAPALFVLSVGCEQGADKPAAKADEKAKTDTTKQAVKPTEAMKKVGAGGAKPMADPPPAPADIPAPADVAAPPADAKTTASGLAYKTLDEGSGKAPTAADTVEVHYTGWQTTGKMFDSSVKRGKPARFPLRGVIAGWTEGLQLMKVGGKTRFWIPEKLAYQGRKGPPEGMLVFDVELLSIVETPKTPPDVEKAPKDAKKTASGLAYKILTPGKGDKKPTATSVVKVHYSGWTTDGKMFDSSVTRGRPATFPLNGVIKGWTEGLQLMNVGDKARLWIPENLAYEGKRPPKGMLVFDVELLEIMQ